MTREYIVGTVAAVCMASAGQALAAGTGSGTPFGSAPPAGGFGYQGPQFGNPGPNFGDALTRPPVPAGNRDYRTVVPSPDRGSPPPPATNPHNQPGSAPPD
jgi:hypothetical protein